MTLPRRIGVTGHQSRPGIDWQRAAASMKDILAGAGTEAHAFTCLAIGTDQVFAREALALGIQVTAVIPMQDYERTFDPADLPAYQELLKQCEILQLQAKGSDEEAFLAAGKRVADEADLLVAVWDGKPAAGLGGTGDIVKYSLERGRQVAHVDPGSGAVTRLVGSNLQTGERND